MLTDEDVDAARVALWMKMILEEADVQHVSEAEMMRWAYDKACDDCAAECEKDDYGAGSSASACLSLKHNKE